MQAKTWITGALAGAALFASLPALACFVAIGALGRTGWQIGTTQLGYLNGALLVVGVAGATVLAG